MERKAYLAVDSLSSHPDVKEIKGGDEVIFLPPNFTSLCQFMDQDVTGILKETIARLLQSLRKVVDKGGEIFEKLKKVNLKDVYWTMQLWRIWNKRH